MPTQPSWKQFERREARWLVSVDEPDPRLHKPRTGDVKGIGNDIASLRWTGELKYTSKKSFSISREMLRKLLTRAKAEGKRPFLEIQFAGEAFGPVYLVFRDQIEEMIRAVKELDHLKAPLRGDDDSCFELVSLASEEISKVAGELLAITYAKLEERELNKEVKAAFRRLTSLAVKLDSFLSKSERSQG
jgi:hypothetical protein